MPWIRALWLCFICSAHYCIPLFRYQFHALYRTKCRIILCVPCILNYGYLFSLPSIHTVFLLFGWEHGGSIIREYKRWVVDDLDQVGQGFYWVGPINIEGIRTHPTNAQLFLIQYPYYSSRECESNPLLISSVAVSSVMYSSSTPPDCPTSPSATL